MPTESTTITTPSTLLEELVERSGVSWRQATVVVGLALILLAVGAAYLDGLLSGPFNADLWRSGMSAPVLIAYVLLIQPPLRRLRDGAIEAFRPLVPVDDDDFRRSLAKASLFSRRREWLAMGIGVAGGLLAHQPWDYSGPFWAWGSVWLPLYGLLSGVLLYGLLGWFIYHALSSTRLFSGLRRHTVEINVFDLGFLEPIGRWSLGIALAFIGGDTLSLLFLSWPTIDTETIIIYIPLILAPVLVFFLNMRSTHDIIVEAKGRDLRMVRDSLAAGSQMLRNRAEKGQVEEMEALLDSFTAWVTYENRVKEVPEWPYTESIMRRLVVSMLLPLGVIVVQALVFELALRLLPLP
jgi:hypothetical protein